MLNCRLKPNPQQHGAAEARRAHNPEVPRSKRGVAIFFFFFLFRCHFFFFTPLHYRPRPLSEIGNKINRVVTEPRARYAAQVPTTPTPPTPASWREHSPSAPESQLADRLARPPRNAPPPPARLRIRGHPGTGHGSHIPHVCRPALRASSYTVCKSRERAPAVSTAAPPGITSHHSRPSRVRACASPVPAISLPSGPGSYILRTRL